MRTQPMTAMVTRPTAVFVGQGASLPLAPGATVTLLGQPTGRVVAARTRGGVEGYIPTNDIEVSSTGWPALAGLLGLGEPRAPGYTGGSGGGSARTTPGQLFQNDGAPSYEPLLHSDYWKSTGHQNYGYPTSIPGVRQHRRSGLTRLSPEGQLAPDNTFAGLFGLGDDVLPPQLDDTEGFLSGGFLRGLIKLAVPIIVIGAGVALGHRWAGIRSQNRRRRNRGRRRNAPYRVKGITGSIKQARSAYDALPAGYRSIVDLNRGRGYRTRKIVAKSGRP